MISYNKPEFNLERELKAQQDQRGDKLRLIVLGTGFAGTSFIESFNRNIGKRNKGRVELIAVNSRNYLLFSPLLFEVATGQVYGYHVSIPVCCTIEDEGYRFMEAEVIDIDPKENEVITSKGNLRYDKLVIAIGSESNDFGIEGVKEYAIPLKRLKDGEKAKNRVLESYREAISGVGQEVDISSLMTFVIIGGGATGVELSFSLQDFIHDLNRSHANRNLKAKVVLVDQEIQLMKGQGTDFSRKLSGLLEGKGVEVLLGKKVVKITEEGVMFSDGSMIHTRNVFWTAGVRANSVVSSLAKKCGDQKSNRLTVDVFLRSTSFENVYVIGDSALIREDGKESSVPQTAAAAYQEGKYLGAFLANELNGLPRKSKFTYREHGTFLSTGRFGGICKLSNGIILTGLTGWFLWRFIHLIRISTFRNKFEILSDWIFSWFHSRVFIESD